MDAADWNARYAGTELVWGAPPNPTIVEQVFGLERRALHPGPDGTVPEHPRALDLGCGEGRHGLWLATHGWQVHSVDFAQVGIDKARTVAARLSRSVRSRMTWQCADVTDLDGADITGPFELILVSYLHFPAAQRRALITSCARRLSVDGTLVVLGHDSANIADGFGGPQDPEILFTPGDVVTDLEWAGVPIRIEKAERILRPTEARDAIDALVVATRLPE